MDIKKTKDGNSLVIALSGRLDTTTSPQLEEAVKGEIDSVTKLEIDFAELQYISSAGLRILLGTQKIMNKQGEMIITHVNDDIKEVFEITGFSDILTVVD